MNTKIASVVLTFLGLISAPVSYWCIITNRTCYGTWIDRFHEPFTQPVYYFFLYAWPAVLLTLFVKESIFRSWLRFVPYYTIIAVLFIVLTPVMQAPGTFLDPFPFYRVNAAELAGQVFSVVTFVLVVWRYIKSYRLSKSESLTK